jgi:hypothetical protein
MLRSTKSIYLLVLAFAFLACASLSVAEVAVGVSIQVGPPALPEYEQPECPAPGYLWGPGYWAYGTDGYYWVPGTWVLAPEPGLLWTPGYWRWARGGYVWHEGYWGPHVGFYGGICYGFGYTGVGFYGGYWRSGVYHYNRAVTQVNVPVVHNTYSRTVVNNTTINHVSYNGGTGGTLAKASAAELTAERERHVPATAEQMHHRHAAGADRGLWASENHGRPAHPALAKHTSASPGKGGDDGASVNPSPERREKNATVHEERANHEKQGHGSREHRGRGR